MNKRFEELDSLRGVAAFIVLISHVLFMFSTIEKEIKSNFSFLEFLWNGHSAVIVFFILSGFVLSLPFLRENKFRYKDYVVRRAFRIYIPYVIILCVTLLAKFFLDSKTGSIPNLQQWALWTKEISVERVLQHIFFLGEFDADAYLMVIWSLVHETRISLIFPFVVLLLFRSNWVTGILAAIVSSLVAYVLMQAFPTEFTLAITTNYFITFHYLGMFIVGALLAKHREKLVRMVQKPLVVYPLAAAAFICYNYPSIPYMVIAKVFPKVNYLLYQILLDWIITFGAAAFIIIALGVKGVSRALLLKPVSFIGEISYSLYLIHPVILIAAVHTFYGQLPVVVILAGSLIATLFGAALCYRWMEKPAMDIGRFLTKGKAKQAARAA